jgi:hypothetical protein
MTLGVGRANDRCTFMISNRSAVFEVASAENSGTTDSGVSDGAIYSRLSYVHIWPGRRQSKAHSASFEV